MNSKMTWAGRLTTLTLLAGLPGCIAPDPGPAIDRTGRLADGRTGASETMAETWAKPFTDRSGLWNGSSPLDRDTAVQIALRNDPELRRQLALVAERQAELAQSSLPPNPAMRRSRVQTARHDPPRSITLWHSPRSAARMRIAPSYTSTGGRAPASPRRRSALNRGRQ